MSKLPIRDATFAPADGGEPRTVTFDQPVSIWEALRAATGTTGVIYDFGMNNGDDVEYYLKKGVPVVGVDANSALCAAVSERFRNEIDDGRLLVLNVALAEHDGGSVPFFIHKTSHVQSQLPRPDDMSQFEEVAVPCRTPASIVRQYGQPLYIKVDVEHFDAKVLRNLFSEGIRPPEISAEAHSIDVFALMVANGYDCFTLVDGKTVPTKYAEAAIATPAGAETFSFKRHSAGPFGDDIRARWDDADTFLHTLSAERLGWKDIHASKSRQPSPAPRERVLTARQAKGLLKSVVRDVADKLR